MIEICKKENCTGCGLCTIVCTKDAISMTKGKYGHLFPVIDKTLCIDCGLCKKKCPSNSTIKSIPPQKAYAAFSNDDKDYRSSTSGAAASVFSNYIIEQGGIVYGCAVCNINDKTLDVKHIRVARKEDLPRLKGSKYVQSRITEILPLLKKDVKAAKEVLFIGTPCQIAAVCNLFNKVPDNLYLIDIVCHGVPSLDMLQKHITKKIGEQDVDNIQFRVGAEYHMLISYKENTLYENHLFNERYKDEYFNSFFYGFICRDSCNNCKYAKDTRISDITIGDFWGLGKMGDTSNIKKHDNGISVILSITSKGEELLNKVNSKFNIYERPVPEAINGNDQLHKPKSINNRTFIFRTLYRFFPFSIAYKLSMLDKKIINIKNVLKTK